MPPKTHDTPRDEHHSPAFERLCYLLEGLDEYVLSSDTCTKNAWVRLLAAADALEEMVNAEGACSCTTLSTLFIQRCAESRFSYETGSSVGLKEQLRAMEAWVNRDA